MLCYVLSCFNLTVLNAGSLVVRSNSVIPIAVNGFYCFGDVSTFCMNSVEPGAGCNMVLPLGGLL
jgi:hypothetical protein